MERKREEKEGFLSGFFSKKEDIPLPPALLTKLAKGRKEQREKEDGKVKKEKKERHLPELPPLPKKAKEEKKELALPKPPEKKLNLKPVLKNTLKELKSHKKHKVMKPSHL